MSVNGYVQGFFCQQCGRFQPHCHQRLHDALKCGIFLQFLLSIQFFFFTMKRATFDAVSFPTGVYMCQHVCDAILQTLWCLSRSGGTNHSELNPAGTSRASTAEGDPLLPDQSQLSLKGCQALRNPIQYQYRSTTERPPELLGLPRAA